MTTAELLADRVICTGSVKMQWEHKKDRNGSPLYRVVNQSNHALAQGLRYREAVAIIDRGRR